MKYIILSITLLTLNFFGHAQSAGKPAPIKNKVSFQAKIDITQATKDGIYLNGYVVNIPYERLTELNGKTVQISGRVTVVPAIKNDTTGAISQGRYEDTKHILKPKVRIVKR